MIYITRLNADMVDPKAKYSEYEPMFTFPNGYVMGKSGEKIEGYVTYEITDADLIEGSQYYHIPNGKKLPFNPITREFAPSSKKEDRLIIEYTDDQLMKKSKIRKFTYRLYINDIAENKLNALKSNLFANAFEFDLFSNIFNSLNSETENALLKNEAEIRKMTVEELTVLVRTKMDEYNNMSGIIFGEKSEMLNKLLLLSDDEVEVTKFFTDNNLLYR